MAKVQEMPDGPKRELNIDIVWNLVLAQRMEPTVKSEEKQNSADIADYRLGKQKVHGSRFYDTWRDLRRTKHQMCRIAVTKQIHQQIRR